MDKMITVVGAGPIGLRTAISLKEHGWDVTVIEEHEEIGVPANCSGLLSVTGLNKNKIDLNLLKFLYSEWTDKQSTQNLLHR